MRVVLLAGGKGARLAPYTAVFPKPLVPVGDMPIIEILIRQLAHFGLTDITVSIGHLGELVQAYFASRSRLPSDVRLTYVTEDKPLGTAGSLRLVEGLTEPFMVMNGDVLTTIDFNRVATFHRENSPALTIGMHQKEVETNLGVIELGENSRVVGYREKPVLSYLVSMGIYVYDPTALDLIPMDHAFDFPDLVLALLAAQKTVLGYRSSDFWLDIGRHEDYEQATREFERRRADFHVD